MKHSAKKLLCVLMCVVMLACTLAVAVSAKSASDSASVLDGLRDEFIGFFQQYWDAAKLDEGSFWGYLMVMPGILLYVSGICFFSIGDILLLPINLILDHYDVI